ncbi:SRPBCC family protein [soil metagenome]
MVDVLTRIEILCPIHEVSQFASNPDNAPAWYVNITSVTWRTARPLSVGSQIDFIAHFFGRTLSYTYEVIEMTEKRFVMQTAQGPFPMQTTYEWESINSSTTRMTLENKGNPTGFSKIFAPFISLMMRNANNKDLKKLKQVLEKS